MTAPKPERRAVRLGRVGGAIGLVGAVAGLAWFTREPATAASHASQARPPQATAATVTGARKLRWKVGATRRYEVTSSSKLRVDAGALLDPSVKVPPQTLKVDIEGSYRLDVIAEQQEHAIVRAALTPRKIRIEVPGEPVVTDQGSLGARMRALLATPLVLRISRTGRIEGVRMPQGLTTEQNVALALKQIPAAMQVVFPSTAGMHRWEGIQQDVTGEFLAGYVVEGNAVTIEKRRYLAVASPQGRMTVGADLGVTPRSTLTIEVDDDGWARTSTAEERLDLTYGGPGVKERGGVNARHDGRLVVTWSETTAEGATDEGVVNWRELDEHPLSHVFPQDAGADDPRPLAELLRDLKAVSALKSEDERSRESAALLQAITERLLRDPGAARALLDLLLRPGELDPEEAGVLIGALGSSGTPASQEALGKIITNDALSTEMHVRAMTQLAFVKTPTEDALSAVRQTMGSTNDEERSTSRLILGAMARSMGTESGAGEVRTLIDQYEKASSLDEQLLLLSALGNTGSPDALPLILRALGSERPSMRLEAVRALRFMPPGVADTAIDRVLHLEESEEVRKGAVFALSFRDLVRHASIIGTVLSRDVSTTVRLAVVNLLGAAMDKYEPARAILTSVATADPDADIRSAAAAFLQSATPRRP
ncbi:HEAT repeat domain-containing protein [Chondromyces crocatus]|uniref:Vitellogenin domain-containing protein n=1 Tax=Chondromyces crocatus TaxID=52 RepID=A0A0K1EHG9_CHOCO|nr:HEAT repeat domain-containing protein [Chondromyces crocatus]AKT40038.1 uncharacterized protein CMC5_041910 [Chondromyces crocatus]